MGDEFGVIVVVMVSVTANTSVWELPFPSPSDTDGPLFVGSVVALFDDSEKVIRHHYNA